MRKAFLASLIFTFASLFIYPDWEMFARMMYFISFPFAKIVYDLLIGFKLLFKINRQDVLVIRHVVGIHYVFLIFLYLICPLVSPLGILYLLIRLIIRKIKQRKST